ncbi:MAG: bifunctional ornithine acetyltransferase/N-acetylglutamate synthase [Candidatus Melainabacteria bacterium RIFCSPHIGHO2_02_FULL_34_12]|nr:MAG: bifunctional ornithine acetyltransferase/N-acetylglutamate synthase [Candidatus Melainabacteria bacterium RIFCSPHIGHO2_02_FULL_34_12]
MFMTLNSFQFSSGTCGFKKTKKPDLAIIYSNIPCTYAGVFTTNQIRAACVDENKALLKKKKKIRAIIVNSGNANACTGEKGVQSVKNTQKIAANLLKVKLDEVLIASTGAIGVQLDMQKMEAGIKSAVPRLNPENFKGAAKAILTTDRFVKSFSMGTKDFKIIGFTKGAGMIHPNMATMLCYLMTDLKMSQSLLQEAVNTAVNISFNNISVDADMSTNDMVIILSNNTSHREVKTSKDPLFLNFQKVLNESCIKLAKQIVLDGEGAQKLIEVTVSGAKTEENAKLIARSIASSNLFKCAIHGSDPNWGRAAAKIGCTNIKVNQNKIDILLNNTSVFRNGNPVAFNKVKLNKEIKKKKGVRVNVNLKLGKKSGTAFGCDLTKEYVNFNSAYFT